MFLQDFPCISGRIQKNAYYTHDALRLCPAFKNHYYSCCLEKKRHLSKYFLKKEPLISIREPIPPATDTICVEHYGERYSNV